MLLAYEEKVFKKVDVLIELLHKLGILYLVHFIHEKPFSEFLYIKKISKLFDLYIGHFMLPFNILEALSVHLSSHLYNCY